ncbi:hypothetical protein DI005_21880 [Prauserella sp. PE36]|uniref:hypothetical protein n=1 Tax=Prauserella sp. PE36 TaxID=1504709 RepID=UPI000D917810|nr:hypothetical protein [Prauserella sp. PE36]PXY20297.1 hypothetical protein BAY59_31130 [Prauserella coralliicola]RBM17349.1 hypothetical protein DI005_21880 [Prauserella sp. PE36]
MRSVPALAAACATAAILAGCSNDTAGSGSAPELPAATTEATASEATAEQAADEPERNERGNIVKQLGEEAGFAGFGGQVGDDTNVLFAIDKVEVDPSCDQYGMAAESGRTLLLHVRVATGSSAETASMALGVLNPYSFSEIDANGVTHAAESGMCTDPNASITMQNFGPNQKYAGTLELIVPEANGSLILSSPGMEGGWEWDY